MRFLSMFSFGCNLIWWNVHRKIVDSRDRFEVLMHSPRKQHLYENNKNGWLYRVFVSQLFINWLGEFTLQKKENKEM